MIDKEFLTENGWPRCDSDDCERLPIPGTNIVIPIRSGDADIILRAWCAWFNKNVEPLEDTKYPDECGWTATNSVADSNHLSGTAVDLNPEKHPFNEYTYFSDRIAQVRWGQQLFRDCIWWGADWRSPHDEMHFQLNFPEDDPRITLLANDLRSGYLGIYDLPEKEKPKVGKHAKPEVLVQADQESFFSLYNLRSMENWRAFIHQVTPVIVTTLVGIGIVTNNQAALWVPLFFAIIDPILSVANTTNKTRRVIYGVTGLAQSGSLATALATMTASSGHVAAATGATLTILSTFLGRFYTPTTTIIPKDVEVYRVNAA